MEIKTLKELKRRTQHQLSIREKRYESEENKEQKLAFSNQIKMYSFMIDRIDYELKLCSVDYEDKNLLTDSLYD